MIDEVIVLGGGAIGSVYAAKLAARHPVTLIARAAHAEAIARHGLRVVGREEGTRSIHAATTVDQIAPGTLVLLTTKVNDSRQAIIPLVDKLRDDTVILCVQNGLGSEDIVRAEVSGRCLVLRAITQFGAIFREPGVVDFTAAGATLLEPSGRSAEIAALLSASGLDGRVSDNIKIEIWRKLIFNCVINPITAIVASEVRGIADPRLDPVKQLVVDECLQVAAADGVTFDIDFVPTIARGVRHGPDDRVDAAGLLKGKADRDRSHERRGRRARQRLRDRVPGQRRVAIIKAMEARADGTMTSCRTRGRHRRQIAPARGDAAPRRDRILAGRARHAAVFETATAALMPPAAGRRSPTSRRWSPSVDLVVSSAATARCCRSPTASARRTSTFRFSASTSAASGSSPRRRCPSCIRRSKRRSAARRASRSA
jgi:2-dehydropantoate 2-reductase